jgi:hypothetical protein
MRWFDGWTAASRHQDVRGPGQPVEFATVPIRAAATQRRRPPQEACHAVTPHCTAQQRRQAHTCVCPPTSLRWRQCCRPNVLLSVNRLEACVQVNQTATRSRVEVVRSTAQTSPPLGKSLAQTACACIAAHTKRVHAKHLGAQQQVSCECVCVCVCVSVAVGAASMSQHTTIVAGRSVNASPLEVHPLVSSWVLLHRAYGGVKSQRVARAKCHPNNVERRTCTSDAHTHLQAVRRVPAPPKRAGRRERRVCDALVCGIYLLQCRTVLHANACVRRVTGTRRSQPCDATRACTAL